MQVALTCHPTTPCEAVRGIGVRVRKTAQGTLKLQYSVEAEVARLRIPAQGAPRRADKLWQHTCFEAFVAEEGVCGQGTGEAGGLREPRLGTAVGYYEFNFAPSREWAIYRFAAYREAMAIAEAALPPQILVQCDMDGLSLEAVTDLTVLPGLRHGCALRLALCAVIEEANGRLSYWALAHPAGKPDFHHAANFALALPNAGGHE